MFFPPPSVFWVLGRSRYMYGIYPQDAFPGHMKVFCGWDSQISKNVGGSWWYLVTGRG